MEYKFLLHRHFIVCALLCVTATARPQGQSCTTAIPALANTVTTVVEQWGPTITESYCPDLGVPEMGGEQLWYVFTPAISGSVEITNCMDPFDGWITFYVLSGSCNALVCGEMIEGYSCFENDMLGYTAQINVVAGQNYFIRWNRILYTGTGATMQFLITTCEMRGEGTCFYDLDSNGIREATDPPYDAIMLRNGEPTLQTGSDPFSVCSSSGEQVLTVANPPPHHTIVPPSHTYTLSQQDPLVTGLDLALQPIPGILDGAVHLYGSSPWIGNTTTAWIHYENIGTEPIDASLEFHLDPLLEFSSASVTPSLVAGNMVTWNLGTLQPYQEGTIQLTIHTPPTVPWNTSVTNWALLTIAGSDVNSSNNIDEWKPSVVAAYDPNDKQVTTEVLTPDDVADRVKLGYTIRFQNTGNAPAMNVVIRDTLDAGLDITTFDMVDATHEYQLSINGNELVWLFPNIMLPDSTSDFDGSIGTFHYRIAMHEELQLGDQVQNEAHIFFDYAEPIITNTVVTTVSIPESIGEHSAQRQLLAHPVPTAGEFNIRWSGEQVDDVKILVVDGLGREVKRMGPMVLHHAQDLPIDMRQHPSGVYTIFIIAKNIAARARVVVKRLE
jgi:uncharacterized repeat protein (TIGR01451 family)